MSRSTIAFHLLLTASALRRNWQAELAARCAAVVGPPRACRRAGLGLHLQVLRRHASDYNHPGGRRVRAVLRCTGDWPVEPELVLGALLPALNPGVAGLVLQSGPQICAAAPPVALAHDGLADLCLMFSTPLPLSNTVGGWGIDAAAFLSMVRDSFAALGVRSLQLPDNPLTLGVLAHFARRVPCPGAGPSAKSDRSDGLVGPVFLRNPSPALVDALVLLQSSHLVSQGGRLPLEWRGHFRLWWQRTPWLDRTLPNVKRLAEVAHQQAADDDARPVPDDHGGVQSPLTLARSIAGRLRAAGGYVPAATTAFALHRPGREPRIVEQLATADLVLQRRLLHILSPLFERLFAPQSYGYRPGRGREDAVNAVRAALREGFVYVLEADVAHCFPSIDHAKLVQRIDEVILRTDVKLRALLLAFVQQPYVLDQRSGVRSGGLAQGAPLSPLWMNLLLTPLDRAFEQPGFRMVRYADDFVVLARSKADAQQALTIAGQVLLNLGLRLAESKTSVGHLRQGFKFLGETFQVQTLEPEEAAVAAQRKPLLITQPWLQLGVNGAALEVRRLGRILGTWPMRRLSGLVVTARCSLSSALLERCAQHDIAIALATQGGRRVTVMAPAQRSLLLAQHRHALWYEALSPSARLALAKVVVQAKLHNAANLVRQRSPSDGLLDALHETCRVLDAAPSTDVLRGHEGHAARLCLRWFQSQLLPQARAAFASKARSRGAPDRLNSAFNFAYHLLYARFHAMVQLRGLNPYLGWLHDSDDDYETLVYDMMEPFRPFIDRLLLRLINRQALRALHFEPKPGAHWLTRDGQRLLAEAVERMFGERAGRHRLRDLMWTQVRAVSDLVSGAGPLWMFRWQLRGDDEAMGQAEPPLLTLDSADDDDGDDEPTDPASP